MHSEVALRKFSFKEEFLEQFLQKSGANRDCTFSRLRVTYDYTKYEEIDAVLLTSQKIILLELVTVTGKFKTNKDKWIKEEIIEEDKPPTQIITIENGTTASPVTEGGVVSKVTIVSTSIANPVTEAKRKTRALKQYIESKMGPRNSNDFDYRVVITSEQCSINDEKDNPVKSKILSYNKVESYANSLKIGWTWWFLEKAVPMWPIWISGYTAIKSALKELPTHDVLVLKSGSKLYGELRKCPGVPYDTTTTSELTFKEGKTSYVFGSAVIYVQGVRRGTGGNMFTSPYQLDPVSLVEFLCIEADTNTQVKAADVVKIVISLRES